jgi:hypothetical protein
VTGAWRVGSALAAGLWAGLLAGCTGAELEPLQRPPVARDDKLALDISLCTRSPGTRVSPLRVLYVVDSSNSMSITDPVDPVTGETARERAVRQSWTGILDRAPTGARIGLLRFAAEAQSRTPVDEDGDGLADRYYTADRTQLDAATASLRNTSRTTNYVGALGEAYFEMRTELRAAALESLPLSKYVVVFLSDGIPDTDESDARDSTEENILAQVDALVELAELFRVGEFAFHTVYLSAGEGPAVDQEAQELLQQMAERGGGVFRSFPSRESLSFLFIDFTVIRRVFTLRGLSALNLNAVHDARQVETLSPLPAPLQGVARIRFPDAFPDGGRLDLDAGPAMDAGTADAGPPDAGPDAGPFNDPLRGFVDLSEDGFLSCGEPMVDTDGDGLADLLELRFGTDPFIDDTDDDGATDRVEWELRESGLDALDPTDSDCFVPNPCLDEDADGLCDCQFDRDLDGVCDCADPGLDPPGDPLTCADPALGLDCVDGDPEVDGDEDGFCDCPDRDGDGRCDYADLDGDGLHDCEEIFYGTARNGGDSDADGLADLLEVRFRSSPVEEDRETDLDWDATPNGIEVRTAGDPWCDDAAVRSRGAYRYAVEELGLQDGSRTCYRAEIENITLVPTAANASVEVYPGNGWNRVLVYAGEVAFDDPDAFPAIRVACVMARFEPDGTYREPASGRVRLRDDDFVPLEELDVETDCRWP